jgi:Zn-dependent protease
MFERAWHIGTFANIPVKIHWTFILLLIGAAVYAGSNGADWQVIAITISFILTLFLCVVLHEFGHALTAKKYGVTTEDIILLPIGGVARLRNLPEKPIQELIIAIMGPMVNVIISILLLASLILLHDISYYNLQNLEELNFAYWSTYLILFNMIPAFPMDGGRVFRALLAMRIGSLKATKIASTLGQIICIGLIIYGIYFGQYILAMIGVFIFISATQEYRSVALDSVIRNKTINDCYRKDYHSLTEYTTVKEAYEFLLHRRDRTFPVINLMGQFCGSVTAKQIQLAFKKSPEIRISEIYNRRLLSLNSSTEILNAMFALRTQSELILVTEQDEVIGIIDMDSIQQFIEMQS